VKSRKKKSKDEEEYRFAEDEDDWVIRQPFQVHRLLNFQGLVEYGQRDVHTSKESLCLCGVTSLVPAPLKNHQVMQVLWQYDEGCAL